MADASEHDPEDRLSANAVNAGLADRDTLRVQATQARDQVDDALDRAVSYPTPEPEAASRHIFAERDRRWNLYPR